MKNAFLLTILMVPFLLLANDYLDFEKMMGKNTSSFSSIKTKEDRDLFTFYKNQYMQKTRFSPELFATSIPKALHFICLGPQGISKEQQKNILSWIQHHPGWSVHLWTDRPRRKHKIPMNRHTTQHFIFLRLLEPYYSTENYREKEELLRYEILYQFGGVAVDLDTSCKKNIEFYLQGHSFVGFLAPLKEGLTSSCVTMSHSVLASSKKHTILEDCIQNTLKKWGDVEKAFSPSSSSDAIQKMIHRTYLSLDASFQNNHTDSSAVVLPTNYGSPKHVMLGL